MMKVCQNERERLLNLWVNTGALQDLSVSAHISQCSFCKAWARSLRSILHQIPANLTDEEQTRIARLVRYEIAKARLSSPVLSFARDWMMSVAISSAFFSTLAGLLVYRHSGWVQKMTSLFFYSAVTDLRFASSLLLYGLVAFMGAIWITIGLMRWRLPIPGLENSRRSR